MKSIQSLKNGMLFGSGFVLALGFGVLVAQTIGTFNSGDVVSSNAINTNFNNIKTTITQNHSIAAPQGAIMAFFLSACPTGWVVADGTNGTPDLRGVFIRGMDNMGSGAAGRDPDWGARGASLGSFQADNFGSHTHNVHSFAGFNALGPIPTQYVSSWASNPSANRINFFQSAAGGNETRPRNVALMYCMRKD